MAAFINLFDQTFPANERCEMLHDFFEQDEHTILEFLKTQHNKLKNDVISLFYELNKSSSQLKWFIGEYLEKFLLDLEEINISELFKLISNLDSYRLDDLIVQYFQNNRLQSQHAFEVIDTDLDTFSKYIPLVLQAVYLSEEYEWYITELKKYLFDKLTEEYGLQSIYRNSPSIIANDILSEYLARDGAILWEKVLGIKFKNFELLKTEQQLELVNWTLSQSAKFNEQSYIELAHLYYRLSVIGHDEDLKSYEALNQLLSIFQNKQFSDFRVCSYLLDAFVHSHTEKINLMLLDLIEYWFVYHDLKFKQLSQLFTINFRKSPSCNALITRWLVSSSIALQMIASDLCDDIKLHKSEMELYPDFSLVDMDVDQATERLVKKVLAWCNGFPDLPAKFLKNILNSIGNEVLATATFEYVYIHFIREYGIKTASIIFDFEYKNEFLNELKAIYLKKYYEYKEQLNSCLDIKELNISTKHKILHRTKAYEDDKRQNEKIHSKSTLLSLFKRSLILYGNTVTYNQIGAGGERIRQESQMASMEVMMEIPISMYSNLDELNLKMLLWRSE